jgi:hypothetical protein
MLLSNFAAANVPAQVADVNAANKTGKSNFAAADVKALVADINTANEHGGANTITLTAKLTSPYVLTAQNNNNNGANGLPVITANDELTIVGNGDAIERSTALNTPFFRLFDVAAGASLTLQNMTLENGKTGGAAAQGGAIYNQGALTLSAVDVADNSATSPGGYGYGGGIWSNGSLTLNGTVLRDNFVQGGVASPGTTVAFGGAVYVAGGTANITNTTFGLNVASSFGGGESFGSALYVAAGQVILASTTVSDNNSYDVGGGVYVAGGTVTLTNDTVQNNTYGGFYIASGATVYIDAFTLANTIDNGNGVNIVGTYIET